jgi:HTH-type transcriptional regulator/antitoxin HigA
MKDELRPVRTAADHKWAMAELKRLWGARKGTAEGNRLDILATLIDAYEAEVFPIDDPDPIAAIQFRMEQMGLSRKDLEPIIGSRGRVAEILKRKRSLSVNMIRRLHEDLGIPAEVLLKRTTLTGKGRATAGSGARGDRPRPKASRAAS